VLAKVGEVRDSAGNLGKVTDHDRTMNSQVIGFKENSLFLEPGKKVSVGALEFDVSKTLVAQHMATNADLHLALSFDTSCQYFKVFFECGFSCWHHGGRKDDLTIIAWHSKN